jgi:hypothetical protein
VGTPASRVDLHDRIEHNMTNHPPVSEDVVCTFEVLRAAFKEAAYTVADYVPASREQSEALTLLETALMFAVAGVARNQ